MTVHMFRVFIGKGNMGIEDLETRVNEWLDQNARWEKDNVTHELSERNSELDETGETYYSLDVRFLQGDPKDNLRQKFTDKLDNKVSWYRVGYHACEHDEENGGPCGWDEKHDWPTSGDVPNYVPELNNG